MLTNIDRNNLRHIQKISGIRRKGTKATKKLVGLCAFEVDLFFVQRANVPTNALRFP